MPVFMLFVWDVVLLLVGWHVTTTTIAATTAFLIVSPTTTTTCSQRWFATSASSSSSSSSTSYNNELLLTSAVLKISFDGSRFSGWSAANDNDHGNDKDKDKDKKSNSNSNSSSSLVKDASRSAARRRSRRLHALNSGHRRDHEQSHRSVQGVLQCHLFKIFGNSVVSVEGCSRTDKGVHATHMVALIYCIDADDESQSQTNDSFSIPGKRTPHPRNATDTTCFRLLPMKLEKLGFTLNRMLPPDIRIMAVADMPNSNHNKGIPFHPTLSSRSKTYEYRIAIGRPCDPTLRRLVWYLGDALVDDTVAVVLDRMRAAAVLLEGRHDFRAFRGAGRGGRDKQLFQTQDTMCHIQNIQILTGTTTTTITWLGNEDFTQIVIRIRANRFLYKMVRFLVGALVAVAMAPQVLRQSDIQHMLDTGHRSIPYECAPPHGLVLVDVEYDTETNPIKWKPVDS